MKHARAKSSTPERRTSPSRSAAAGSSADRIRQRQADRHAQAKSKRKADKKQFLYKLKIFLAVTFFIVAVVCFAIGAGMYAAIANEMSEYDFESIAHNFSSTLYATDSSGNSIEVAHLHSDGNREWVDSDKIPEIAKKAAVAIEDERFYKHHGVDFKRTAGAVFGYVTSKLTGKSPSYGGSTITQQVIKNITNEKDKTAARKIKEMMRAVAFEKQFTKDEILTMYLNIAYFGNNCYGIEASSKMYFGKPSLELNAREAAMIVGITQAPTRFDPYRNPENCTGKRNLVLSKMYEHEMISKEDYDTFTAADLGIKKRTTVNSSIYSYFVDQVINDVIEDLQTQKGYSQSFASSQIFSGGLRIYTTMDPNIQAAMESVYVDTSNFPQASKGTQSAMTIIDPYTGEIKGLVGGVGIKKESRGLNRATQSTRQPGSSIKPISVYAPSLEEKKITSATVITDAPLTIGEWSPKNSYTGFKGDMSVSKAIEISANIPAVKTLQSLGIETSFNYMKNKYHFTTLKDSDKNLIALGLGGMTNGVSTMEMAAAYAIFPNNGKYITPHTYTKVLDSAGKVLLEKKIETTKVISEANAFIMTSFLKNVVNGSAGTGKNARLSGFGTYGKTGTSNDNCDKWFVGYTPYYVGAVWFGMDTMKPLTSLGISNNISTQVWKKVMQKVHQGLPEKSITAPNNVTAVAICQTTGKLAASGCSTTRSEYFVNGTVPSKSCGPTYHAAVVPPVTGDETSGVVDDDESVSTENVSPTASEKPATENNTTTIPDQSESEQKPTEAPQATPKPTQKPTEKPIQKPAPNPTGDDVITLE